MKHLVIAAASLILVSCGNMNYHRSGKLRKVRVERSSKKEASAPIVAHKKKRNFTISMTEDATLDQNSPINDVESEVPRELSHTSWGVDREIEDVVFSEKAPDQEVSEIIEEEALKSKDLHQREKKGEQAKVSRRKKSKKLKQVRIDWEVVGYYSLIALALVLIVVGLIFEPVITLAILTVLSVIAIIAICAAICWFFVEIFSMIFDVF